MSDPRSNLRAFADLVERPMTTWQARAFDLVTPVTAIVAGRGSGKSRSLATFAAWSAFRTADFRVLIVSASEASARRLLAEVREVVGAEVLRGSVIDELAGLVRLSNGSTVRSVPSSERTVRGNVVDLCAIDEAAFVDDSLLLSACYPTTAARGGRIVLASSAGIAAGGFFDEVERGLAGSENVRTHRWVVKAAGGDCEADWITPSVVARERESLGALRFAAEFEARFASGADSLFSAATLDRATADYVPDQLAEMHGPSRVLGGTDWGQTNNRSALVAIGRLPLPGERLFAVRTVRRWPAAHPGPDVVQEILDSPAAFDTLTSEVNGLGGPLTEILFRGMLRRRPEQGGGRRRPRYVSFTIEDELRAERKPKRRRQERPEHPSFRTRKVKLTTTAPQKAATYSALRLLMDRGHLLLPASEEELRRELLMLRVSLTAQGNEKIQPTGSGHDDLADALAAAIGPYKARDGEWRTRLDDLASTKRQIFGEVINPDPSASAVETGAGHLVPVHPTWASVAGPERSGELISAMPPPRLSPAQVAARAALADTLDDIQTRGSKC